MERVVRRSTKEQQQSADLAYWLQRPMHERIAAVELLRRDWESSTACADAEPRLQRVCRVAQRRGR
jgi:hypothetical protein